MNNINFNSNETLLYVLPHISSLQWPTVKQCVPIELFESIELPKKKRELRSASAEHRKEYVAFYALNLILFVNRKFVMDIGQSTICGWQ